MKNVRHIVQIGMLAAVAIVLTLIRIPIVPNIYDLDFSEVPVLIGTFAMGPVAGILIEAIKVLFDFLMGSHTGGIGELANFLMGCALCVPAGFLYRGNKTKKRAVISLSISIVVLIVVASLLNAYVLLPMYLGRDALDATIASLGFAKVNGLWSFILLVCAPFNLLKGSLNSLLVILIYKKIRTILK